MMQASPYLLEQLQTQSNTYTILFILALAILLSLIAFFTSQRCIKLILPAHVESVRKVARAAERFARKAHLSDQAVFHCQLAVDEACMNIIEHAYAGQRTGGMFEVYLAAKDGEWIIELTDFGSPFDPDKVNREKDTTVEGAKIGGWGIHFMRSVMDEVTYTTGLEGNHLQMIKRRST